MAADAPGHAEHLVARPDAGHARPDGLDRAGEIDAEDGGKRMPRMPRRARTDLDVERPGRDTFVGYHRDLRRLTRMRELLDLVIERLAH